MKGEDGTIIKSWAKNVKVALVFPDNYNIAMSSLAFQSLYGFINGLEWALCDRFVFSYKKSLERGFELFRYEIIIFTVPFVLNLLNVVRILSANRIYKDKTDKLICIGGIAVSANPQAIADFVDIVFTGTIEDHRSDIETIIKLYRAGANKEEISSLIKKRIIDQGHNPNIHLLKDVIPPHTVVYTKETEFASTHLVEIQRGCVGHCRFCLSRYLNQRYTEFDYKNIIKAIDKCKEHIRTIGLIGDAILSHSKIKRIVDYIIGTGRRPAFASLRIQDFNDENIEIILKSDIKTITVAPEVASERLMRLIGKEYDRKKLLSVLRLLVKEGVNNIKLYMMIGLPSESDDDILSMVDFIKLVRDELVDASRGKGRVGRLKVTINNFVPSPFTPMSGFNCDDIRSLSTKQVRIRGMLSGLPNLDLTFLDIYETLYQTSLFRMDPFQAKKLLYLEDISIKKRFLKDSEFANIIMNICYGN